MVPSLKDHESEGGLAQWNSPILAIDLPGVGRTSTDEGSAFWVHSPVSAPESGAIAANVPESRRYRAARSAGSSRMGADSEGA